MFALETPLMRRLLIVGALALTFGALASQADAAAPPPESTTDCYGALTATPTADEPNLIDYRFHCDGRITAYTVIVNRGYNGTNTIDDFSVNANVFEPDGVTPDSTTAWSCEGTVPSISTNCNTGSQTGYMAAWNWADGTVDTTDPYCKNLPSGAKPGTPAEPQAFVQLIVSDTSGAQDGPFRLPYTKACPAVPDRVPFPAKPKTKHRKKHAKTTAKGSK